MRSVSVLTVVLSLVVLAAPGLRAARGQAAAESPVTLRSTIEELLRELEAPKLADRRRAERTLLDLGPDALPLLPAPELTPNVSVREAVRCVRVQLERRAAKESALASRITLSGETTVAELLAQFTKQTRNRVELSDKARDAAKMSLSVDFDDRPFWECLDEVCERLKLRAEFDAQRSSLKLIPLKPDDPAELAVQRTGPFRLAIHSAEIRPVVGATDRRLLRVAGRIALEPRLRPLFLHFATSEMKGSVVEGKSLAPFSPAARYEHPVSDAGREVPVQFDYLLPNSTDPDEKAAPTKINLSGRIALQLAAGTERIVFDKTSQTTGASRRRGGVTVRLREVKFEPLVDAADKPADPLRAEIGVAVSYDAGGPAFESHRTWMFHNAVYLETEAGRRIDFTEYDTNQQADGAVAVGYRWDKLAAPATQYKFVYEAPTLILDLPLEVKLDGIRVKPMTP